MAGAAENLRIVMDRTSRDTLTIDREQELALQARMRDQATASVWLWILPILLLVTALAVPQLDRDAFHHDEVFSMLAAGMLRSGPHSLADVWNYIAELDPHQAQGWPLLLSVWGYSVGWNVFAARAIPLFAGILTLALVFRAGSDLFSAPTGLIATLLLAGSAFFFAYLSIARAFTLVALFTTLILWSYCRITLQPRPPGRGAQAGLLLGSIGLLYAHYFGALLLPVLGLFHLLFVPQNRRWWQPVLLVGLAVLVAALQLPGFLSGLNKAVANEALRQIAISATEIPERFLYYLSNLLVTLSPSVAAASLVLLLLALVVATLLRLRSGKRADAGWLLVFVAATSFLLMIAVNEAVRMMQSNRIRYLMPLWPLSALLAAAALRPLVNRQRRLLTGLLVLWLSLGAYVSLGSDFRYEVDFLQRSDFHHVYRLMRERLPEADFLILDYEAERLDPGRLYTRSLGLPYKIIYRDRESPLSSVGSAHVPYPYAWMLFRSQDSGFIAEQAAGLGRVFCDGVLEAWGYTLERYALSPAHCPDSATRLEYDSGIALTGPDIRLEDSALRLFAGLRSADEGLLARYSLAVHVIDAPTGERVAQGDVGAGPGAFVPLRSEIDISMLPAGDYEVHFALYDWQTGARLPARDPGTGTVSDMHSLYRFRIE